MENKEISETQEIVQDSISKDKPRAGLFALRLAVCAAALCALWVVYMYNSSAFKNISAWYEKNFCAELISPQDAVCKAENIAVKIKNKACEAADMFKSTTNV